MPERPLALRDVCLEMIEAEVNRGSRKDAIEWLKRAHWEINALMLPRIAMLVGPHGTPDYQPAPIGREGGGWLFGLPVVWTQKPGITLVHGKIEGGEG